MLIRAKAPLRISFAGGGTDIAPIPDLLGGVVLSVTIARYANAAAVPVSRACGGEPGWADAGGGFEEKLADAVAQRLGVAQLPDRAVLVRSEVPAGSGLGASSAIGVSVVGLYSEYFRLGLGARQVAEVAAAVERTDLGMRGGLQDHYAAAFGGLNYMCFTGSDVEVRRVEVDPAALREIEESLLLCHTGTTRESMRLIDDQMRRFAVGERGTMDGLLAQKEIAEAMYGCLVRGRLSEFAELLHLSWQRKKMLSPLISTPEIDEAYELALANGASGGKITGAGGGGYLLLYCRCAAQARVVAAMRRFGWAAERVSFDLCGMRTWRAEKPEDWR